MNNIDTLAKLYVEITTHCNLDCQMCVRRAWSEPYGHMPLATFDDLLAEVDHLPTPPTIHLSGYGEPMHHPHFLEIIRRVKEAGAQVELTTNGTLLNPDIAAALIELEVDRLMVSIDSVHPEAYNDIRLHSSFDQVIANMRYLRRLKLRRVGRYGRPHIGIAFVAMQRNVDDLPRLPWLSTYIGAGEIQVSNLVPHTPDMEKDILYQKALKACAYRPSPWVANMSLPKLDLSGPTLERLGQLFGSTASLSLLDVSLAGRNDYCRFAQQGYAVVRWDGEVSPCLPLLHDHPMYLLGRRKEITHYSLGNINRQPFREIWHSPEFTDFRARLRRFPFSPCTTCGGCERFPANLEDCTDNLFPICGGCLWAQGFVQCP